MKNIFKNNYVIIIGTLIVGITIGWMISPSGSQSTESSAHQHDTASEIWTCSMHPSVRQSEPGKCPICGMDLIPLESEGDDSMTDVMMSETAMKLANIQTTVVGSGNPEKEIRLNGRVTIDERKNSSQSAHIPGRIEQLLVNYTGEVIQRGQTIAQIYSPELVTAQQELFEAAKIKDSQPLLFQAAKDKLKNWKLTDKQIESILTSGKPQERFPLVADVAGIVTERRVNVGDYVMRGAPIYDVTDLSSVWVLFDVYENDMPWVKKNDNVEFTIQSLPGEVFKERISFIDPILNPATRVATARVEIGNTNLRLKPEMYATGMVKSEIGKSKDMIVPKSAVMWTGERSIVYIKSTTDEGVSFHLQEVTLGPSLGDSYVVKDGLQTGMEVVTNGTFTIDAAAQLAGKPSMMNPVGGESSTGHNHGGGENKEAVRHQMGATFEVDSKFKKQIAGLLEPYLEVKNELVKTNSTGAAANVVQFAAKLNAVDMNLAKGEAHTEWMTLLKTLKTSAEEIQKSNDVEKQRQLFSDMSNAFYDAITQFDIEGLNAYYQFCPMAFDDKGAYWISKDSQIANPYFGDKMMRCGVTKSELK